MVFVPPSAWIWLQASAALPHCRFLPRASSVHVVHRLPRPSAAHALQDFLLRVVAKKGLSRELKQFTSNHKASVNLPKNFAIASAHVAQATSSSPTTFKLCAKADMGSGVPFKNHPPKGTSFNTDSTSKYKDCSHIRYRKPAKSMNPAM